MDMELTYIYHSGFALSGDGFTVIMDYYRDSEDGQAQADLNRLMDGTFSNQEAGMPEGIVHSELLRRPGKLYVLASHFHPDHLIKRYCNGVNSGRILSIFSRKTFCVIAGRRKKMPSG